MLSGLEQCVQQILSLPAGNHELFFPNSLDIHKGLHDLKDLDQKYHNVNKKLQDLQYDFLNRAKPTKQRITDKKGSANDKLAKEIANLQDQCINLSKSKVDVAHHTYDSVYSDLLIKVKIDKHIELLDEELKKFEDDLKVQADQLNALQGNTRKSKLAQKISHKLKVKLKASEKNMINNAINVGNDIMEAANTPVDKNEPRYCVCNGVSFGEMIKCDNEWCEKEWFHFSCIGITKSHKIKGKWYCKDCRNSKTAISPSK